MKQKKLRILFGAFETGGKKGKRGQDGVSRGRKRGQKRGEVKEMMA